jgi:hypothetical protein
MTSATQRNACHDGGMENTLHVFRSVADPDITGLSVDMEGANIPGYYGEWEHLGIALPLDSALASMAQEVASLLQRDGYCLVRKATAGLIWPATPERGIG